MYIYEGHMGGLYCTDDVQDWESLYCEQCGDSDWELGYAETLEDAWKLLKDKTATFDDSKCLTCPHDEDYEYCDEHCEDYKHSGGYNLNYIMQFLVENFECDKLHYIYLISKHEEDKNYVFVIPVDKELDLKKCASITNEKYIEMIKSKDLLNTTGYVHGGCSPIGMKKFFPTFIDETIKQFESIIFSGGKIGLQVEVKLEDLCKVIKFSYNNLIKKEERVTLK